MVSAVGQCSVHTDVGATKCSSYIVIILFLRSVQVTSIARLSVPGRGIPPLRFSWRFLIFP